MKNEDYLLVCKSKAAELVTDLRWTIENSSDEMLKILLIDLVESATRVKARLELIHTVSKEGTE